MPSANYILVYPAFSTDDARLIDDFRALHDYEKRSFIAPHFTLVYPQAGLGSPESIARMRATAARTAPIRGRLGSVIPWREADETLIYLVPDDGNADLMMLHVRLTPAIQMPRTEPAPAFIPHMTIGRTTDQGAAERICAEFYGRGVRLPFLIEDIVLVSVEGDSLTELARCRLSG